VSKRDYLSNHFELELLIINNYVQQNNWIYFSRKIIKLHTTYKVINLFRNDTNLMQSVSMLNILGNLFVRTEALLRLN
jgi:hypothetical protein